VNWERGTQRAGSGCPRARASSAPSTRAAPPSRSPRWSGTSPTKPPGPRDSPPGINTFIQGHTPDSGDRGDGADRRFAYLLLTAVTPHKVESVRRVLVLIHGPLTVGGGRYRGMGVFAAEAGE